MVTTNELPNSSESAVEEQPLEELVPIEEGVATPTLEEVQEQNKKLYARAKKAEEKLKTTPKIEKPVASPAPTNSVDDIDSVLSLQAEGYSPSEIKSLREYGRKMGKPIQEVATDPVIKAGFEAMRIQAKTADALPSPSKRTFSHKGKSLNDAILGGNPADAKAAIEQYAAQKLGPKTNNE